MHTHEHNLKFIRSASLESLNFGDIAAEFSAMQRPIREVFPHLSGFDTADTLQATAVPKPDRTPRLAVSVAPELARAAVESGRIERLRLWLAVQSQGVSPGDEFTVSDLGWHRDKTAKLKRIASWGTGSHGKVKFRLMSAHGMAQVMRGRKAKVAKWTAAPLAVPFMVLEKAADFRRLLVNKFVEANPGKHFMAALAQRFGVSRSTTRRDMRALGVLVRANYIEVAARSHAWLRAVGAGWWIIEARKQGDAHRRLLASVSAGWFQHWQSAGYEMVALVRTANSYHQLE